jgi:lycopene cyclase domain-containing protein
MKWYYLLINLFSIAGPLILSFDKKVAFFKSIQSILWSISIVSSIYLLWDVIFTKLGIWEFNSKYVLGHFLFSLPFEEYLFFLAIPYCCLFIYACLRHYLPKVNYPRYAHLFIGLLGLVSISIVYFNFSKLYTAVTFSLLFFTLMNYWLNLTNYLTHALLAWFIALIPMAIVNGLLTGLPILIYNNEQNLGIRIGTIPIEDFFYNLILMLWMITLYERSKRRIAKRLAKT